MNDNLPRQVPGRGGKFELKTVFCQALDRFLQSLELVQSLSGHTRTTARR